MIRYLADSSALWRLAREPLIQGAWAGTIASRAIGSCHPQRTAFRRSARNLDEYEELTAAFDSLYPDAPLPKSTWRWVESAQYRLTRAGAQRALSCVDLLICACAALNGLVVLHDDKDFVTAARHLPDLAERSVLRVPDQPGSPDHPA